MELVSKIAQVVFLGGILILSQLELNSDKPEKGIYWLVLGIFMYQVFYL